MNETANILLQPHPSPFLYGLYATQLYAVTGLSPHLIAGANKGAFMLKSSQDRDITSYL